MNRILVKGEKKGRKTERTAVARHVKNDIENRLGGWVAGAQGLVMGMGEKKLLLSWRNVLLLVRLTAECKIDVLGQSEKWGIARGIARGMFCKKRRVSPE